MYAALPAWGRGGDVYEVKPAGELEPDPPGEISTGSYLAPVAAVVAVVRRAIGPEEAALRISAFLLTLAADDAAVVTPSPSQITRELSYRRVRLGPMRFLASRTPLRVLVVEDEDNAALLVQVILASEHGIIVVGRARHGREALTMAAALSPEVILMDLNMPVMNGVEAIRRLRELGSKARIVVTTGVDDAAMLQDARAAGADALVAKPPTREELLAALVPA